MSSTESVTQAEPAGESAAKKSKAIRLWPGGVLLAIYWAVVTAMGQADLPISTTFMTCMAASALLGLLLAIWWLTNATVPWSERAIGLAAVLLGGVAAGVVGDPSVGPIGLIFMGVPLIATIWFGWLLLARNQTSSVRRWGAVLVALLVCGVLILVRTDGIDGSNHAAVSWRWSPSAEDAYLSQRAQSEDASPSTSASDMTEPLVLAEGDWPEFRGPDRQGELHGVQIATDWSSAPPKQLWRQRIGPAWSSVVIIGARLFTQEQRGENEAVVCLDAATGRELWSHEDKTRFSDGQAGAGPRATPTFSDGQIYTFGASGILNCLDAASGTLKWSRNIVTDSAAPLPMWGFSSSPLVGDGVVVVYAGGEKDKGLLAYHVADGEPAWSVATGSVSYSSPQFVTLDGQRQILFLSDNGLVAIAPESGRVLWQHDAPSAGIWRTVQPRQLQEHELLIGSEDLGLVRLDVRGPDDSWSASETWRSRALRPAYNDFVLADDSVYGFDEAIFCCVDAQTGKRRWKQGRYGHGQVLLLADQKLLLVVTESGEAVLLAADPEEHRELGRFQAIEGKSWSHPVIARGRLFVRNDQEIACYDVAAGP